MSKAFIQRFIFIMLLIAIRPLAGFSNDGCIKRFHDLSGIYKGAFSDTVPQTKKPEENVPSNAKPDIIKEVPKSRRQVKPVAVPKVPVKPIKITKPKIIRRTIGILG